MSTEFQIKEASREHIQQLSVFQKAMAYETEGRDLDMSLLLQGVEAVFSGRDKGFYVVAEIADSVIGGLLVTPEWSDWRNATFWWIQSVYVDPEWRRKGVYRAMHEHVVTGAKAHKNICGIRLYVERSNYVAQQTYENLGMSRAHYDMFEIDFIL